MMLRYIQAGVVLYGKAGFLSDPSQPLPPGADREALDRLKIAE